MKQLLTYLGQNKKRQYMLAGFLCLLLMLPAIIVVSQGSQNTQSQAAGPITVTAGATSSNGNYVSGKNNQLSATKVTTGAQAGTLQNISIYVYRVNNSPRNHVQVALYADNGANAPGNLIASSQSQVAVARSWNTFAVGGSLPVTANTNYWLVFNVDGSNTQLSWANGSGKSVTHSNTTFGTWPVTFGSVNSTTTKPYAFYMIYTYQLVTPTPLPTVSATVAPSGGVPTAMPTTSPTACATVSANIMNTNTYTCPLFSPTSPWNSLVTGSIDPNSATMITSTAVGSLSYSFSKTGHGFDIQGTASYPDYSIPLYYADATTPRVNVGDSTGWWGGLTSVPMPTQAKPSVGSDHHLSVWDVPNHTIYEFWDTVNNSGTWKAGLGAKLDTNGSGYQTKAWSGSARAYGGSAIAGAIRYQEMKDGVINHALAMAYPWTRGKSYAMGLGTDGVTQNIATHTDNDSSASRNTASNIPEGARLRLKASVDVNAKCGTNNACKVIGRALQNYGAYVVDNSGVATLYAEVLTGKSVSWTGLLTISDARAFAASDFEVMSLPATLTTAP
jgi:hypothetical protein